MVIITSSRKPSVEVRKIAKEIAFALDLPYIQRGKAGVRELEAAEPVIIFLSGEKNGGIIFDITVRGEIAFSMLITDIIVNERTGVFRKGFITRERELYDFLSPYVPTVFDEDAGCALSFAGTQKKEYVLHVMV